MQLTLLMRGFVVLGVIMMHTTWFFSRNNTETLITLSAMLLDIISLFAVPLFMFISGYIFSSKHKHADAYSFSFFKKMFFSVLSPYLLFSLMYILGTYFYTNSEYSIWQITKMLLTGTAAIHLGFFRALFGFFIFYPLIIKLFMQSYRQNNLILYFLAVIILQITWKSVNALNVSEPIFIYLIMALTFLRYIAYFSFGIAAWIYQKQLLNWIDAHTRHLSYLLLMSIPLVAICWQSKYYWHNNPALEFICFPLNLILYTVIIGLIFRYTIKLSLQKSFSSKLITYIGNYSFGIFLLHILFMQLGAKMLLTVNITPGQVIFYPLLFVIMLLFSVLSVEILVRIPFHKYLIGNIQSIPLLRKKDTDSK